MSDEVWKNRDDEWAGPSELEVVNRLLRMAACISPSGMLGAGSGADATVVVGGTEVFPMETEGGGSEVGRLVETETGRGRDDCI